jgi:hypothetical protein
MNKNGFKIAENFNFGVFYVAQATSNGSLLCRFNLRNLCSVQECLGQQLELGSPALARLRALASVQL